MFWKMTPLRTLCLRNHQSSLHVYFNNISQYKRRPFSKRAKWNIIRLESSIHFLYTTGEDLCGVCGGSGSSCADCAGTANGKSQIDLCGSCLLPTDANFNAGCSKLGPIKPNVVYVDQLSGGASEVKATIGRSGPTVSGNAVCSFFVGSFSSTWVNFCSHVEHFSLNNFNYNLCILTQTRACVCTNSQWNSLTWVCIIQK